MRVDFGFHKHGNCWGLRSLIPTVTKYRSGSLLWLSWWRLFVSVSKVLLFASTAFAQPYGPHSQQAIDAARNVGTFAVGSQASLDNERGLIAAGYVRVYDSQGGWHWSRNPAKQPLVKVRTLSDYWTKPDG